MKHEFTWTSRYSGGCVDESCPGHYIHTAKCTCGWTKDYADKPYDEENFMLKHRLDYLEGVAQ